MATANRVLVIEPDAATRDRYSRWLAIEGFDVAASKNDSEALGILERDAASFFVVLANILSAKWLALFEKIMAVRSDLPIIALAADNRSSVAAIEKGALHCLQRPVEEEPLREIVALVNRQHLKRWPAMRVRHSSPRPSAGSFSATDAKNEFATILETAVARGPVFITKHDTRRAVVLGLDEFNALTGLPNERLSGLSAAFDEMLNEMQRPDFQARMKAAFDASPEELGEAAVQAARKS
jgi:antitoxin Phd